MQFWGLLPQPALCLMTTLLLNPFEESVKDERALVMVSRVIAATMWWAFIFG